MPLAHGIAGDDDVSRRVSVSTLAADAEISVLGDDVRHAPLGRRGAAHGDGTKKTVFSVLARKMGKTYIQLSSPPTGSRPGVVARGGAKYDARPSRFPDQLPVYLITPGHPRRPAFPHLGHRGR